MAEGYPSNSNDIGELRGEVDSLKGGLATVARQVDTVARQVEDGIKGLTNYIRESNEKGEQRIATLAERTDARLQAQAERADQRFEDQNRAQLALVAGRGGNTWQIIAIVVPALLSLGGLGFAGWSLAKAPVDDKFSAIAIALTTIEADLKAAPQRYVPREESNNNISTITGSLKVISDRQFNIAVQQAMSNATATAQIENTKERLAELREDSKDIRDASATKTQITDLNERYTVLSNRLQSVFDKNFATTKYPCLDSGAGCGPVTLPGPSAQPSGSPGK